MSGTDRETLAVYEARARDYSALHHGPETAQRLRAFVTALPRGGTALDLGCGPGWAAAEMRDAGLHVTALDASPEMAEVARARYGLAVTVAPFDALADEAAFDGIWAHFSLLHAPRAALPGHFAAIRRALRPRGLLAVAMKLGAGAGRDRLGRLYTYVGRDELRGLLTEAGFAPESEEVRMSMGFDGTEGETLYMTARCD
ncbi:Methyltransferase domain-containing protein [Rhodovulum sp. ES.010]|uniref:class I SAM-dependent methyltransferase n=1 Tax=Rhodovulum sp. ES.010 TaxID=1882821 RepID=UPI000929A0E1|nr:class I SAM-dependent methyltransferase [Rhodovulum sp. ES.010]SIO52179.1 Methyltransferase domain-containing protein [Rhodovulum sp. ES.010]